MGTIHDLLVAKGKQGTLNLDVRREVIEAATEYLGNEDTGIGFLFSGWCQAALPHKRLPDGQDWQVDAENISLIVESGARPGLNGKPVNVGVPFGARARMILFYLQSEALRTQSPEVRLGSSMRDWLERMGIPWGGGVVKAVREQSERIAYCRLTFHMRRGGKVGLLNQNIIEAAMFEPSMDGSGKLLAENARLSDGFFQQLQKHPVPIEEAAVKALSNNSQGLDVYAWLAYRLHALSKPQPVSWKALKAQFGLGIGRMVDFRRLFLANVQLALAVYPDAKIEVGDGGMILHPSRPPVAPRQLAPGS
ncbi:replication protein RepA [Rhodovastum atsumiense]|uniref:Plasmid replication initiator n=1 Tax=Rhodovastum atsumiense TaxID=504468 RepID=A0A5M6ITT0_9PROT|nr:replication protein RepA [Rhodovastum atsumiense]KAA5611621.1 plasmid replication initiator [Rhodovastum atsumiense]